MVFSLVQQNLRSGREGLLLDRPAIVAPGCRCAPGVRRPAGVNLLGLQVRCRPGFIPTQDQGYLIVFAQLPDGASLQRAEEVRNQISELTRTVPGVAHSVEFAGFAALDGTNRNNAVTVFLPLAPFEERVKDREAEWI